MREAHRAGEKAEMNEDNDGTVTGPIRKVGKAPGDWRETASLDPVKQRASSSADVFPSTSGVGLTV